MNVTDESRSAIAGYVGRFACVLNFGDVPPGIGLAAVEIGEAVDLRQLPAGRDFPFQRDTSGSCASAATARPTNAGLSEMAKCGEALVAARQFASVPP